MINRFKEMIDAGVAAPKYDNKFSAYRNNANYHTLDNITRLYNDVWGMLTCTQMRHDVINDEYIITGQAVHTANFKKLFDMEYFDTTCFWNSFKQENIHTLREFFRHFGLAFEFTKFNNDDAVRCWHGLDETANAVNSVYGTELGDLSFDCGAYCLPCMCSELDAAFEAQSHDLKSYANDPTMRKYNATNLSELCEALGLIRIGDTIRFNTAEKAIELCAEAAKKADFSECSILEAANSSICNSELFAVYRNYINDNNQLIRESVEVVAKTTKLTEAEKKQAIAKILFPFTEMYSDKIQGIGKLNVFENCISIDYINNERKVLEFNTDFTNSLVSSLTFFESAE